MKVFVLVNTLQQVSNFIYPNHIEFFTWTAKHRPDIEFRFMTPTRFSIDNARNTAGEASLYHECDYLMFLDDDVLLPPNTLDLLLQADKDIVAGLVIIRGYPFNAMAFKYRNRDLGFLSELGFLNEIPLEVPCGQGHINFTEGCEECKILPLQTLVPCDAVGFSCCLIKTDILKALPAPWFVTGRWNTEDIYFCVKALEQLTPPPGIFLHTGVQCGHLLNPEAIEWKVREKMKSFYRDEHESREHDFHRDIDYINQCIKVLG